MAIPSQGWVFLCNNKTQEDCFRRCIVGTSEKYQNRLVSLKAGDPVLLYNYESGLLVGHFTASSGMKLDLVQDDWGKRYRAQVPLKLESRFNNPVSRQTLESVPGLAFDKRGYLWNFSLPVELVQHVLDLALGQATSPSLPGRKDETDFRKRFPANFLCSDGHWVRSKAELLIDNWLYTRRPPIAHAYERRLPVPEEAYADFYLPIGECYIEYWGLDSPEYTARRRKKLEIFKKYGFRVISLEEHDLEELDDLLPLKLLEVFPESYRFQ